MGPAACRVARAPGGHLGGAALLAQVWSSWEAVGEIHEAGRSASHPAPSDANSAPRARESPVAPSASAHVVRPKRSASPLEAWNRLPWRRWRPGRSARSLGVWDLQRGPAPTRRDLAAART